MEVMTEKVKDFYFKMLSFITNEKGQTLVEYGLILILIAVLVALMLSRTGQQVNSLYSTINSAIP